MKFKKKLENWSKQPRFTVYTWHKNQIFCFRFPFVKAICLKFLFLYLRQRQHIPETFCFLIYCYQFFSFLSFIWFCHFTPPYQNLNFFLLLSFLKFTIPSVLKICHIFIPNIWLAKNTCSIIFREKITLD